MIRTPHRICLTDLDELDARAQLEAWTDWNPSTPDRIDLDALALAEAEARIFPPDKEGARTRIVPPPGQWKAWKAIPWHDPKKPLPGERRHA
jgi:hypothetical protein